MLNQFIKTRKLYQKWYQNREVIDVSEAFTIFNTLIYS